MKNILKTIFAVLIVSTLVISYSCEDENAGIYQGPSLVSFSAGLSGSYYVLENDDPGYLITVGYTTVSDQDRTVTFDVTGGDAVDGTHYTLGATSVTVPAGEVIGYIEVNGIFSAFQGQVNTLEFTLTGDDVASFDNVFTLSLQRYCPFDIDEFVGTWTVSDVSDYDGPYADYNITTEVHNGDTLVIHGLWENAPDVLMVMDDTDPANFTATIFDQYYATHGTYGEMRIRQMSQGTFSACQKTVSVSYEIYVAAGFFDKVSSSDWTFVGK